MYNFIRLQWDDPITEEPQEIVAQLPLAIGRELGALPPDHHPLVFGNSAISRKHLIVFRKGQEVFIKDLNSTNGTILNGTKFKNAEKKLQSGDTLKLASFQIDITLHTSLKPGLASKTSVLLNHPTNIIPASEISNSEISKSGPVTSPGSTIIFNPRTDEIESTLLKISNKGFPFTEEWQREFVNVSDLYAMNRKVEETTYVSLGGGIGSFVFVDTLRIYGVNRDQIAAIGLKSKPYERYQNLLENCQIKTKYRKRIRSGSDSCPDNIWGFPGYALRDAWRAFFNGQEEQAMYPLWQVFSEPIGADTYTPRAEDVFASMDREMERIGWSNIIRSGVIKSIRKTEDGRYAIAYITNQTPGKQEEKFLLARYLHLCTGYPALKLLDDLQTYRDKYNETTENVKTVVHGYEPHDYIYEALEARGGAIVIRGFGIVASQILDRVYAARTANKNITVYHLGRSPKYGNIFPPAKRYVEHNWEFQPYNWPKSCWGGDLRNQLEAAEPFKRRELLQAWGGTTTASRSDWRKYIDQGLKDGWYKQIFGQVETIEKNSSGQIIIKLNPRGENGRTEEITADYIVDCTGLVSDPQASPLLNDLITHYNLDLNPEKRLHTQDDFEIKKMRNQQGKMYAAGIITLGSCYAGVDTFLGLQYSAHRIAESLTRMRAPQMEGLNPLRSLAQWLKWMMGANP